MYWSRLRWRYWRDLFRRRDLEREMDEELRVHIALETQQRIECGESPEEARTSALRDLGSVDVVKEASRDAWNWQGAERLIQDLRFACRQFGKNPGFTIAVIGSLALGIGGNTAIFSIVDQVLLRSLPVQHPSQLVIVQSPGARDGRTRSDDGTGAGSFSYPMYKDLREKQPALSGLLARFGFDASIEFNGQTKRGKGELVSGNYFDVLGVRPQLGRLLVKEDEAAPGGNTVVVLSHVFWQRIFASRTDILNRQIVVNGHSLTIVGVAPPQFFGVQLGYQTDVFVPITIKAQMTPNWDGLADHKDYWLNILGRLKPGVTAQQAQAQMAAVYRPLLEAEADAQGMTGDRRARFVGKPLLLDPGAAGRQLLSDATQTPLLVLMAMVVLVLLIACANVANLLVARAMARERETAVRLAIGASRTRLIRQCLVESLLLSGGGAILGLLIAHWIVLGLLRLMPPDSGARTLSAALDVRVLLFTCVLALATGLVFGFLPALEGMRFDLATGLKSGTASSSSSRHNRIRKSLVAGQVAFTLLMVTGAGMFGKTLLKLQAVDVGMKTENVLRFGLAPDLNGYTSGQSRDIYQRLQSALRAVPGIVNASLARTPIFAGDDSGSNVTVEGYMPALDEDMNLFRNEVGTGYFATLGIPLVSGREFLDSDRLESPKVCMINQATAERFFKARNPLGYHIAFGSGDRTVPDMTIVGIVKNSKHSEVGEDIRRFIYVPYTQSTTVNQMTFYMRSTISSESLMPTVRAKVRDVDPSLPVTAMKPLDTQIAESLHSQRLMMTLSMGFGILAAILAGFGIYGVMSYLVSKRTREIGIRMAIGAQPSLVCWMIAREILTLAGIGIVVGLPLAVVLGKSAQSLLYGMNGADVPTVILSSAAVLLLSVLAGYSPTRRAIRIDPVTALRDE